MAVISELAVNVVARTGGLEAGLKKGKRAFASFKSTIASGMAMLGGGMSIGWVAKLGMDMEQTEVRFATMMGSMTKAKGLLGEIQAFAAKTPFKFPDLADGAASLMSFGIAADDVMEKMQFLGDIASGSGTPLETLVNIFGKVRAKGKLGGEEIMRLLESGVNALPALAAQMGVLEEDVLGLVSSGKISFADFDAAMKSMSQKGGDYFNAMEDQSKTLRGQLSTLGDAFWAVGVNLGTALLPLLKIMTNLVKSAVDTWNGLSDRFKKVVVILGTMAVAFGVALKSMMLVLKITKAISIAQAAQNVIVAVGQALAGNWKAVAAAAAVALTVGVGMSAILSKQDDQLASQEKQENKNIKAVEKKLDAVKGVTDEEKKQVELLKKQEDAMKSRAKSIADSVLTPMEQAVKAQQEVNNLRDKGFLDAESARRKSAEIDKTLLSASGGDKKDIQKASAIGAATFRSAAGFSAAQEGKRVQEQIKQIAAQQLAEQKRQTDLLDRLDRNTADPNFRSVNGVGI